MAISAKDRFARLPKARQAKILARAEEMIAEEMTLTKLREARARSQAELAAKLGIQQAAVSRLERRTDMYLSTLRNLIASMGGTLRIIAQFPDRPPVCINQFHDAFAIESERAEVSPPSSASTANDPHSCKEIPIGNISIEVERGQSSPSSSGSTALDPPQRKKLPKQSGWHRRKTN